MPVRLLINLGQQSGQKWNSHDSYYWCSAGLTAKTVWAHLCTWKSYVISLGKGGSYWWLSWTKPDGQRDNSRISLWKSSAGRQDIVFPLSKHATIKQAFLGQRCALTERGCCCGLCMATGQQPKHRNDSERRKEGGGMVVRTEGRGQDLFSLSGVIYLSLWRHTESKKSLMYSVFSD